MASNAAADIARLQKQLRDVKLEKASIESTMRRKEVTICKAPHVIVLAVSESLREYHDVRQICMYGIPGSLGPSTICLSTCLSNALAAAF